ncbi:metalloregulator ArsR/SmtB family transcription factor [Tateyamaria omphalii]|uniref:ArsR/SmtB family transcription factor n=1 Tax=Tateyamaria omphalii TaxID=299262 RepID=UPI001C998738|nr:metalloregulator ArsR/SmtB family transcription factor [Tateyamaria omphalii]MBY5935389.1 metalloregulator ArsR/SmtB family transcription factor [Tateyamaria omphalii]
MNSDDQLDAAFAALAHPVRRAILARLAKGTATVNTLAEPFEMSLPAVSRHIRVLETAGLIKRDRNAQFRPCTLEPGPLKDIAAWTDMYRPIWEARFDTMEQLLHDMKDDS